MYGLAPTKGWFYSGPVFDFFGNSGVTAIRSLGTKVVEPDQVGKGILTMISYEIQGMPGLEVWLIL